MPKPTADQIVVQSTLRFFYQPGGACPSNAVKYGGRDGQFLNIEEATNPVRNIDTISVQDPKTPGRFLRVGRNRSAPDFPTASVTFLQRRGFVPEQLVRIRQEATTYYAVSGETQDLTDFLQGWTNYVKIYSYGEVTEVSEGGGSWDSGEQVEDSLDHTFEYIYTIGPLVMSEKASAQVLSEVVDLAYGSFGNGYTAVYSVINEVGASAGASPSVVYRTKDTGNWTQVYINGAVAADVPHGIAVIGSYLVVIFDNGTTGGYYYASINPDTGVPGAFSKVTSGFVTSKAPKGIWAPDSRSGFIVGEGGYVYKIKTVPGGVEVVDAGIATTEQLNRIDGTGGGTMVAVGESDAIIVSTDRGRSWTAAPAVTGGGNGLDALAVVSEKIWWLGDDGGDLYYTEDGGNTWTNSGVMGSTIATVQDIKFPTAEVGYVLAATSGPAAVLYTTYDGGNTWTTAEPRISSTPTADRFNRIAIPDYPDPAITANYAAIGGLAGNGTDGIILIVEPQML